MRPSVPLLLLGSLCLAACGKPEPIKPDPTKPIPWIQRPKDPQAIVAPPDRSGRCAVSPRYDKVLLADALASPAAYAGKKIQIAGWLGTTIHFIGPAVEGVPVCNAHSAYFLGDSEQESPLFEEEDGLAIRAPEPVKVGTWCASTEVPDAEVVAAWGTVSAAGDEVLLDGLCAADELPCETAQQCPGVMTCGAATGRCELP
jgi:hypothetical protein